MRTSGNFAARASCEQGLCGCCTVLVDGSAVTGCLYLGAFVDGCNVETIERIEVNGNLSAEQEAFIECGAFQCGFCTPGFILMTRQLLDENPVPEEEDIRHYLSGNLCRCAAYPEIVKAVQLAASKRAAARQSSATVFQSKEESLWGMNLSNLSTTLCEVENSVRHST